MSLRKKTGLALSSPGVIARVTMPVAIVLALALTGCVSRSSYNRDVNELRRELKAARGGESKILGSFEMKVQDRGKTLSEITNRYIKLQVEKKHLQEKMNLLRPELEVLQQDIDELKLVINKNMEKFRSTMANELLIKLIDMEYRVGELLRIDAGGVADEKDEGAKNGPKGEGGPEVEADKDPGTR